MARSKPSRQAPEPLADTKEVAEYLRKEPHTLENWRSKGFGPAWIKNGHDVLYRWSDVEEWLSSRQRGGTSQRGAA